MIMGISVHQKVMDELTRVKIQIDEKIGQGNFSEVYLGSRNKHKFAIKIQEKSTFERFQDLRGSRLKLTSEVETLSKLNHVRIISMFEWFQTETCIQLPAAVPPPCLSRVSGGTSMRIHRRVAESFSTSFQKPGGSISASSGSFSESFWRSGGSFGRLRGPLGRLFGDLGPSWGRIGKKS